MLRRWGAGGTQLLLLLLLLHCLALAALADAGSKWGPDNPKPWILKYQKYIGPFMAMCAPTPLPPLLTPPLSSLAGRSGAEGGGGMSACSADRQPGARRLTFVILGGMILFICMYERKERKQWPFGPWDAKAEEKTAK